MIPITLIMGKQILDLLETHDGDRRRPTTSAPPAAARPPSRDLRMGRERPLGGFELWTWLFMRISGLLLLVLAVGHVLIMHLPDGGVDRVDFGFVATRWESPFWRTWDWMLLVARADPRDQRPAQHHARLRRSAPGVRFAVNMFFYVLGFMLFVLGTIIVVTFDPSKWPGAV